MDDAKKTFLTNGLVDAVAFRKGILRIVITALILVPTSGIIIMTFLGVFPWPDLLYVLIEYSGIVIVINVALILGLSNRIANDIVHTVENSSQDERDELALLIKRRLPVLFFTIIFLYTAQGAISANLSLEHFHGYDYDTAHCFLTLYGIIPTLLISGFPIYFYLTDHLGRYLAPRGINVAIAPLSVKFTILGLFTPLLIDTVLLLYYYDRTQYLTFETIALWFVLLIIAGLGTLLAWRSMMQSMSPIEKYLHNMEVSNHIDPQGPVPQSLDEIGSLTMRYATMLKKNYQMESDLSHKRRFVNAVIENAAALVLVLDKEGKIRRFNHACEKLTGYKFSEVCNGYAWDYFIDPKEADAVRTNAFDALANDPERLTGTYINSWISRARKRYLIEWSNSLLLNADGEMEYMVSIGIDITEKNKSEQALIESYQMQKSMLLLSQYLETAKSFNDIVESLATVIQATIGYSDAWMYIVDSDDNRYYRMLAKVGERIDRLDDHPDILRIDMHSDPLLKELSEATDIVVVEDMQVDPRTDKEKVAATGLRTSVHVPLLLGERRFGVLGTGTFGDEGIRLPTDAEKVFLSSVAKQVAAACDRIIYEEELNQHRDNLESLVEERTLELKAAQGELLRKERLATLGQLTATVSHELRNPLGAMRPSTYVLRQKMEPGDDAMRRAVDRIERGIERCDHIIDELLDFTRTPQLEKLNQDLDRWMDGVVKDHAFPDGLKIDVNHGLDGLHTDFDAHRLRRALVNILDNAAQALVSEADGQVAENASLHLQTQRSNGRVELVLQDNGPGIAEEILPKIFEPLFSTKNFGVGLGMSAVKLIMEQHNGGIDVASMPGEGTTVTLWLPVTPNESPLH